jgi:hypothetical protein
MLTSCPKSLPYSSRIQEKEFRKRGKEKGQGSTYFSGYASEIKLSLAPDTPLILLILYLPEETTKLRDEPDYFPNLTTNINL